MSSSSNNTMDNHNTAQNAKSNDSAQATGLPNVPTKRSNGDASEQETKRSKIETPTQDRRLPMAPCAIINTPRFVSAATLATTAVEITDQELLELTLEFERQHGI